MQTNKQTMKNINRELQHVMTENCKRISYLQNSSDPHKHELIELLSQEIGKAKKLLK